MQQITLVRYWSQVHPLYWKSVIWVEFSSQIRHKSPKNCQQLGIWIRATSDSGGSPALAFDSEVLESNLATADLWPEDDDDNDNSGNEMEGSSYLAASNVLDLADQWSDSGEEEPDFYYGPEDFSFLHDDMLE